MKNLIRNLKKEENLPFVVFFVCMLFVHFRIHLITGSDDDFMFSAVRTGDLSQLYANNRVFVNFFGSFLLSFPLIFWKILNIAVLMFLVIRISGVVKILNRELEDHDAAMINWGICILFLLTPINVLSSGAFWVTGSFNYMWALCGSLFAAAPFLIDMAGIQVKRSQLAAGLVIGIYACDTEQTMVIVCLCGAVYLASSFFTKKRISRGMVFYGLVLILECTPIVFLPFNSYRSIGEQGVYFPDFAMLSVLDKVYQGAMHFYEHLVNRMALLFFLISFFSAILAFRTVKNRLFHIISMIPLCYFAYVLFMPAAFFRFIENLGLKYRIFDFSEGLYYFGMRKIAMIPFFFATFVFVLLFLILWDILQTGYQKYIVSFFYLAALADGMMMSFAPSIFVSGNRVFFASDMLLLAVASVLGGGVMTVVHISKSAKKVFSVIVFCGILLLSGIIANLQSKGIVY